MSMPETLKELPLEVVTLLWIDAYRNPIRVALEDVATEYEQKQLDFALALLQRPESQMQMILSV